MNKTEIREHADNLARLFYSEMKALEDPGRWTVNQYFNEHWSVINGGLTNHPLTDLDDIMHVLTVVTERLGFGEYQNRTVAEYLNDHPDDSIATRLH
ncbi:MAG TPA: hypothetical protein VJG49_02040 [Candidatus Nanoarchaeia archaeon]|nr:hypothetical protein [Candidatus Nanoarchaeia archaeon]